MAELLTTKEAAEKLGVSYVRINQLIKSGELTAEKKGRDYLIKASAPKILKNRPERKNRPRSANPSQTALEMRRKRKKIKSRNLIREYSLIT